MDYVLGKYRTHREKSILMLLQLVDVGREGVRPAEG